MTLHTPLDVYYHSYYLVGIRDLLGSPRFHVRRGEGPTTRPELLACEFHDAGLRVVFDARDGIWYDPRGLGWADVYAKINFDPARPPAPSRARVVPLGPGFAVRAWGPVQTIVACLLSVPPPGLGRRALRRHLADFWRQYRYRLPIAEYEREGPPSSPEYVFTMSSLWTGASECNEARARFMRVCRTIPGVVFEGGFAPRLTTDVPGYEELTTAGRCSMAEYVERTRRSAVVFNTPAVAECHGWKLGEFLALGKAILSTPLSRALPAPLEHGVHVHFVDGSEAGIRDGAERILRDAPYRRALERGARQYYLDHVRPRSAVARVLRAGTAD
ncbi:MAG TPA: hypothetical protein VF179_31255 [Thermoanaerobaculia bacterium]|nr:hypothetical protein [Thermoanaerobaculia bacterium]